MKLHVTFTDGSIFLGVPLNKGAVLDHFNVVKLVGVHYEKDIRTLLDDCNAQESDGCLVVDIPEEMNLTHYLFHVDPEVTYEGLVEDDEEDLNSDTLVNRHAEFKVLMTRQPWDEMQGTSGAISSTIVEINAMVSADILKHFCDEGDTDYLLRLAFPYAKDAEPITVRHLELMLPKPIYATEHFKCWLDENVIDDPIATILGLLDYLVDEHFQKENA